MVDASISVTEGSGKNVDTRTNDAGDHRQVVVLGNPTATDSVASVQATDPSSSALGVVVRDPLGTLTYGLMDSSGIRVRSISDGTIGVENITRVKNVVDGTLSTVSRVSNVVDGTLSTVTRVDRVFNLIDGTISTVTNVTRVDRVHNLVDGTISSGTLDYVTRVRNIVDGTISNVDTVTRVNRVHNLVDGTLSLLTRADRVMNLIDGTLSTVTGVDRVRNVIDGTLATVVRVTNLIDGTVRVGNITGSTLQVNVGTIAGTTAVYLHSTAGTIVTKLARDSAGIATDDAVFTIGTGTGVPMMGLADAASQDSVDEDDVGVLRMTLNRLLMTNIQATAGIFTVTGSTSGGTTSGVTLVAPSASYNFKVFAYSLQTTGVVSEAWRFTNGAGSETELWRPLITAASSSSSPVGANLAVSPPGYIFATGTNTTLALKSSTGSLVHYSVSYIKESA